MGGLLIASPFIFITKCQRGLIENNFQPANPLFRFTCTVSADFFLRFRRSGLA
jgi:hypothetical protein